MANDSPYPVNYYVDIAGAGAYWVLRINDVSIWSHFASDDTNLSLPVNAFLKTGRNEISVNFMSVTGSPAEYNLADPDFYFQARIDRIDLVTRDSERATLLNLALDQDNVVISPEVTKFGSAPDERTSPPMKTGEDRQDEAALIGGWGDEWTGRRITADFEISDPLPEPPWASAPVLADTPETRARLLAAYRDLHAILQSGDKRRIQASYEPAWRHLVVAMNYDSLDEFIEKTAPFEALAPDDGQGGMLEPLDLVLGPENFEIERMGGGRLIRIVPDPILWRRDGKYIASTNVAFFQGPDGNLQVGAVLY